MSAPAATGPVGPTERGSIAQRERLLDEAALGGLDVAAARTRVDQLRGARRRTRRGAAGGAALVALLAIVVVVWPDGDDPDQLLADREERTTTSTTSTPPRSTTTAQPPSTSAVAPTTVAPVTTALPPTTTLPPATSTTLPPNQPMQAQLRLPPGEVAAGAPVTIEVAWVDPDHSGVAPTLAVDWGDPAVAEFSTVPLAVGCDRPGASGGGVLSRQFRYATPGVHTVRVRVTTCDAGLGGYGEQVELVGSIRVGAARVEDGPGRVVLAVLVDGDPAPGAVPPLDTAAAILVPADETLDPVELAARTPVLAQVHVSPSLTGLATVLVVPVEAEGTVELTWDASPCRGAASVPGSADPVLVVALPVTC